MSRVQEALIERSIPERQSPRFGLGYSFGNTNSACPHSPLCLFTPLAGKTRMPPAQSSIRLLNQRRSSSRHLFFNDARGISSAIDPRAVTTSYFP